MSASSTLPVSKLAGSSHGRMGIQKSYAEMLKPQATSSMVSIHMRPPTQIRGEPTIIFSEKEMIMAEKNHQHTLILKFLRGRPSLDAIKLHVLKRWGLTNIPTIGIMDPRHIMEKISLNPGLGNHGRWRVLCLGFAMVTIFQW
ncbi:hypothetical protein I3842_06G001400 [Carya illinoinensis]|uniref:Uncharacterized protein n=1 Tax=Carya illinoinensis TaxID=32201 RepID=A0A922JIQ1_CARIL|nr:hypothetical protein I3842_06G001400 [Carya illinoinensis]